MRLAPSSVTSAIGLTSALPAPWPELSCYREGAIERCRYIYIEGAQIALCGDADLAGRKSASFRRASAVNTPRSGSNNNCYHSLYYHYHYHYHYHYYYIDNFIDAF